jgi:hypothetical protein
MGEKEMEEFFKQSQELLSQLSALRSGKIKPEEIRELVLFNLSGEEALKLRSVLLALKSGTSRDDVLKLVFLMGVREFYKQLIFNSFKRFREEKGEDSYE